MARTLTRPADPALYQEDFYVWTQRQAELLRAGRFAELDLAHLIEEVEDLGINLRNAVTSRTREIILHLLKLEYSPAIDPRQGWRESVGKQRDDLELELTVTLRRHLAEELEDIFHKARRRAAAALAVDRVTEAALPASCPYTLDQILDPVWLPANLHGIDDHAGA